MLFLLNLASLQLMNTSTETILAKYHQQSEKAVEHGAYYERARNVAKMQAVKVEAKQAKKKLAEEEGESPH